MALELWFPPQSREFGWGMDITEEQIVSINEMRMGKEYFDTVAAKDVNGIEQKLLTTSPFICLFEFGGRNGYWTGNHMIFQTKIVLTALKQSWTNAMRLDSFLS
jgi:hypothetical protein